MPYTQLSISGVPGARHAFTPKTPEIPIPPVPPPPPVSTPGGGGGGIWYGDRDWEYEKKFKLRKQILKEDEEILAIISMMLLQN